jgi:hypothetical protein
MDMAGRPTRLNSKQMIAGSSGKKQFEKVMTAGQTIT